MRDEVPSVRRLPYAGVVLAAHHAARRALGEV